jgi:hypothetical protein
MDRMRGVRPDGVWFCTTRSGLVEKVSGVCPRCTESERGAVAGTKTPWNLKVTRAAEKRCAVEPLTPNVDAIADPRLQSQV